MSSFMVYHHIIFPPNIYFLVKNSAPKVSFRNMFMLFILFKLIRLSGVAVMSCCYLSLIQFNKIYTCLFPAPLRPMSQHRPERFQ